MKGRTNVGGGGIALNANAVNKEIKSGNIIAGDFVQYYTEESIIEQSGFNFILGNIRGYFVTIFSNYEDYHSYGGSIRLFKNGRQISSYSGYEINDACIYGNYIIFCSPSSNIFGVLKIDSNGNLILVDTISASYANNVAAGNGKVCGFYCSTSSSTQNMNFSVCNISDEGLLSSVNNQRVLGSGMGYKSRIIFNDYNNSFYIIGTNYAASSSVFLRKIEIDNDNVVTLDASQKSIRDTIANGILYQNNDLIVCGDQGHIYLLTVSTTAEIVINLPTNYTASNIVNGYFVAAENNTSGNSNINLYYFNETNKEITLISENTFDLQIASNYLTKFIEGSNLYVKNYNNYNLNLLNIIGNEYIEKKLDTDYVVPFSQYGHPIGVAKDAGSNGDIIGVYVPVVSL